MKTSIFVIYVCCSYLESIIGMELLLKMKYQEDQNFANTNPLPESLEQKLEKSDDCLLKLVCISSVAKKSTNGIYAFAATRPCRRKFNYTKF